MHRSSYKTRRRFEIANQPRFLTFCCYKRLPLFGNDAIKDAFATRLEVSRVRLGFRLCAWVVMPEHVHLIIVPNLPEVSTSQILSAIKRPFAELVLRRWKQLRAPILKHVRVATDRYRFWQAGGGYDRNVRDEGEMLRKIEYIYANPVNRGVVDKPVDWRWSSARWYAGFCDGPVEVDWW